MKIKLEILKTRPEVVRLLVESQTILAKLEHPLAKTLQAKKFPCEFITSCFVSVGSELKVDY